VKRVEEQIHPYYFKEERKRPPKGIETMLRMYLLQIWFNLADEALEEQGKILRGGSIVDATIIEAPASQFTAQRRTAHRAVILKCISAGKGTNGILG
jgi:hypothetical protein